MTKQEFMQVAEWITDGVCEHRLPNDQWTLTARNYPLCFDDFFGLYRRKPEPKLRAWNPEEVPVGCLIRNSEWPKGNRVLLTESINDAIYLPHLGEHARYTLEAMRGSGWEHSLDGGKTWNPCGVYE